LLLCLVGAMGALKYVVIGAVVVAAIVIALVLLLQTPHRVPVQYFGSPSGYEAFVPNGQTISYNGQTDPVGDLILNNGTTIQNVIWDGQDAGIIIVDHIGIGQLNGEWVGRTDPINYQPYVPLQDFYVIKGQVPVEQVTINGQTYYVIDANNINPADIAGFYTYPGFIRDFIAAINMQGTYAAVLPGNSPVFQWENLTGTVAYQTIKYEQYGLNASGRAVLVLPNGNIITYGTIDSLSGTDIPFDFPQQVYNSSS